MLNQVRSASTLHSSSTCAFQSETSLFYFSSAILVPVQVAGRADSNGALSDNRILLDLHC